MRPKILAPAVFYNVRAAGFVFDTLVPSRIESVQFHRKHISVECIGKALAHAIVAGESVKLEWHRTWPDGSANFVYFDQYQLELGQGYVTEMLEFVGNHKWFWDELPHGRQRVSDHTFNSSAITPGLFFERVRELNEEALRLEQIAHSEPLDEGEYLMHQEYAQTASVLFSTAASLFRPPACYQEHFRRARRLQQG